jgi:transketolase
MLNQDLKLKENIFDSPDMSATRTGFGIGLVEVGTLDDRVVALCADLTESTQVAAFKKAFPERYIEVGVAEQNMAALGSGFAAAGKVPFITSYAAFNPGRNWEQIRTTIALNDVPVKICGMHAGISVGPDGATHQMLEDIALMRAMPNMTVISPCDAEEARKATIAVASYPHPVYMRFSREKTPIMTTTDTPFEIGKANVLWKSEMVKSDITIFATGPLLYQALLAAKQLEEGIGVTVVNVATIKPLDCETILREAKSAGAVVTVEEHQIAGGMGSAIAELLAQECPMPIEFVGVRDQFGQSGTMSELIEHYSMGVSHIVSAIQEVISRKNS